MFSVFSVNSFLPGLRMSLSVSLLVVFECIHNLSVFIINPSTDQDKMFFFFCFSPSNQHFSYWFSN